MFHSVRAAAVEDGARAGCEPVACRRRTGASAWSTSAAPPAFWPTRRAIVGAQPQRLGLGQRRAGLARVLQRGLDRARARRAAGRRRCRTGRAASGPAPACRGRRAPRPPCAWRGSRAAGRPARPGGAGSPRAGCARRTGARDRSAGRSLSARVSWRNASWVAADVDRVGGGAQVAVGRGAVVAGELEVARDDARRPGPAR